jgi:single-stranded-DNA-specific exonuclease
MIMNKKWVFKQAGHEDVIRELSSSLRISSLLANLLVQRNINTLEDARAFFRPELSQLHDPFAMKDMDKAVARIKKAMDEKEKILVYGDYDVDGTTSVALFFGYLKQRKDILTDYYIPDRYKEGYGISYQGIDWAFENGFTLIIALDCGIKSVDHVNYSKAKGIDFIICDHHMPGDTLPDAHAVLDPKRKDCGYPYKELSGCGIGFKLVHACCIAFGEPLDYLWSALELAAISIAADIVPITGENRILAYYGLKQLNESPRAGIRKLLETSRLKKSILSISDIVFVIGPRINAAGRIKDARDAVRLLLAETAQDALPLTACINERNDERIAIDHRITAEALEMFENDPSLKVRKSNVLYHPSWHKGVIGIVASRVLEKHYKPTIILTRSHDMITGSARSVKGFDIYEAISSCSDLLEQFGGHKYAAGLSLRPEKIEAFSERFEQIVSETISEEMLVPEIEIDAAADFASFTPSFMNVLKQFAPFGPGNMAPVFSTDNVQRRNYRLIKNEHLSLSVASGNCSFEGMAFQMAHKESALTSGDPLRICYTLEENEWKGTTSLRLNIKDIQT